MCAETTLAKVLQDDEDLDNCVYGNPSDFESKFDGNIIGDDGIPDNL